MLQLYYDRNCYFCRRVLHFMESEQIPFEHKELSLRSCSPERTELIEMSGRSQVPFLVDPKRQEQLPESLDIIDYLTEHYLGMPPHR